MSWVANLLGRVASLVSRVANPMVLAVALVSVLGFFGGVWWPLDLFAHFKLHYALVALPFAVFLSVRRDGRGAVIGWVVVALNAGFVAPLAWSPEATEGRGFRVLVANVNRDNLSFRSLAEVIVDTDPDVIGLVEVGDRWLEELQEVLVRYPYRSLHPRDDNFGVALYSRHEFLIDDVVPQPLTGFPTARVVARIHGERVQFALLHLPPPLNATWSRVRDLHLQQFARMRQNSEGRFVLMGDFNATPWSAGLRHLLRDAGMRRAGRGILATWPSSFGALGIPIDHVLLHGSLGSRGVVVGPDIGSDHRPLVVDLLL